MNFLGEINAFPMNYKLYSMYNRTMKTDKPKGLRVVHNSVA
ncbi:MAG: hypothetical protein PWP35_76 [Bacteroidales bacterium]|jgi:hypothetical protein|nr:hypothetical protein [Bacteroidales bacterium]